MRRDIGRSPTKDLVNGSSLEMQIKGNRGPEASVVHRAGEWLMSGGEW